MTHPWRRQPARACAADWKKAVYSCWVARNNMYISHLNFRRTLQSSIVVAVLMTIEKSLQVSMRAIIVWLLFFENYFLRLFCCHVQLGRRMKSGQVVFPETPRVEASRGGQCESRRDGALTRCPWPPAGLPSAAVDPAPLFSFSFSVSARLLAE